MVSLLLTLSVISSTAATPVNELTLSPSAEYLPKFTHHEGTQLRYGYTVSPGMQLFGQWREHWSMGATGMTWELIEKVREEPQLSTQVLLRRAIVFGALLAPLRAELSDQRTLTFRVAVGAGVGELAVQFGPRSRPSPFFASAGPRLTGYSALELELRLGERFAVNASVDDHFFGSYVETLNGCTREDITPLVLKDAPTPAFFDGRSNHCDLSSFPSISELSAAHSALREIRTDIRHVQAVTLGVSLFF